MRFFKYYITQERRELYVVQLRLDEKLSVPFFGFTTIRIIFVINVPLCAIVSRPIKDGRTPIVR